MAVNATYLSSAPATRGGKAAGGYPLKTNDGQTLYCLVRHSYHTCGVGTAACCRDGSNPNHKHKDNTALVVGLSVGGGVLFLCLLGGGAWCVMKRHRRKGARENLGLKNDAAATDEEVPGAVQGTVVAVQGTVADGTPVMVHENPKQSQSEVVHATDANTEKTGSAVPA